MTYCLWTSQSYLYRCTVASYLIDSFYFPRCPQNYNFPIWFITQSSWMMFTSSTLCIKEQMKQRIQSNRAVTIHVSKPKSQHSDPRTCLVLWEGRIATQLPFQISPMSCKLHHINTAAVIRQFSAIVRSHRAKHRCEDEPLHNSHRKPALRLLKRRDGTRHDVDVCVFSRGFPGFSPVNQNPTEVVFQANVYWSLGPEGWTSERFFFIINTRWVKVFFASNRRCLSGRNVTRSR